MHGFWRTWMTIWCSATIGLGAVLSGAAFPSTDGGARFYFELLGNFTSRVAIFDAPASRLAVSVLGAVMVGWGLTMLGIVRAPHAVAQPWRSLTTAIAMWFTVDSVLSIACGYPLNAGANVLFLATYLAAVIGSGVLTNDSSTHPDVTRRMPQV